MSILMQRHVRVDGKLRTDATYPAGFMDVIDIPKTDEHFRLVYDTKGRFVAHRITKARRLRAARAARAAAAAATAGLPRGRAGMPAQPFCELWGQGEARRRRDAARCLPARGGGAAASVTESASSGRALALDRQTWVCRLRPAAPLRASLPRCGRDGRAARRGARRRRPATSCSR